MRRHACARALHPCPTHRQPRGSRAEFTSSRVAQGPATRRRQRMRFRAVRHPEPQIAALPCFPFPAICPLTSFRKKCFFRSGAFVMKNRSTRSQPSTIVNRTVTPRRPRNSDLREREYLTPKEVDRLQDAARKHSRYGHRDATAVLIAYRHGLRASELCELTWNMIEL